MSKKQLKALTGISVVIVAVFVALFAGKIGSKADSKNVYDPISAEFLSKYDNVLTIPELQLEQKDVTVIGQVAYSYPSKADGAVNNFILQDVVDGEVVGLLVNDETNKDLYVVGDVVSVKGTVGEYGGVFEFK